MAVFICEVERVLVSRVFGRFGQEHTTITTGAGVVRSLLRTRSLQSFCVQAEAYSRCFAGWREMGRVGAHSLSPRGQAVVDLRFRSSGNSNITCTSLRNRRKPRLVCPAKRGLFRNSRRATAGSKWPRIEYKSVSASSLRRSSGFAQGRSDMPSDRADYRQRLFSYWTQNLCAVYVD